MKVIFLILLISICSCSSKKKTLIYSSLVGGVTGSLGGALLSPDKESRGANAAVFGLVGAGVAALTGYALYKEDPRNELFDNMIRDTKKREIDDGKVDINLGAINIDATLSKKESYQVPLVDLPEKLKGKVNQQYIIKHRSKEQFINKGNKTYYIPAFEVFEHAYEKKGNDEIKEE
ncbi:MAG: hypothetical protein ACPGJV_12955 [Bacteriovoracaceae bacterium]